jgi:hypothetical protein
MTLPLMLVLLSWLVYPRGPSRRFIKHSWLNAPRIHWGQAWDSPGLIPGAPTRGWIHA